MGLYVGWSRMVGAPRAATPTAKGGRAKQAKRKEHLGLGFTPHSPRRQLQSSASALRNAAAM
jgi:hypothetical protein